MRIHLVRICYIILLFHTVVNITFDDINYMQVIHWMWYIDIDFKVIIGMLIDYGIIISGK